MSYYKFMTTALTVVDFGLNSEQEERAAALHKEIIVFDSMMECSWYDGMLEKMKRLFNILGD